jgi:acetoacetate decarboxylase
MKIDDILKKNTTPLCVPAYAPGRHHFYNREYLNVVYETDPEALREVVPEPLEIEGNTVRFEFIMMPDSTGLGNYTESGQAISVSFNGEKGDYLSAMYVSSVGAISSGRETSAYPKKAGHSSLTVDGDTLVGTLDYGSLRIATATMGYKWQRLSEAEAVGVISRPTFMLKIQHGLQGELEKCLLTRMPPLRDLVVKWAWTGPARLQLFEHALAPVADLPVKRIVAASHILTDLNLEPVTPVFDYLQRK